MSMSPDRKRAVAANLFRGALPAVEPCWDQFLWHPSAEKCDSHRKHSSQALAIDLFGTVKMSPDRDAILDEWASSLGLPTGGPWKVSLEWKDPDNLLAELQQTQVDAVAKSSRALILFECKFTERGEPCSQTRPRFRGPHKGVRQCSGRYERQLNPINGITARCPLSGKGIRYWEYIPKVFDFCAEKDYAPCPFAGSWFQWMRNLVLSHIVSEKYGLASSFVLVYAEAKGLPISEMVHSGGLADFNSHVRSGLGVSPLSYQFLVQEARRVATRDTTTIDDLGRWIDNKIAKVVQRHTSSRTPRSRRPIKDD